MRSRLGLALLLVALLVACPAIASDRDEALAHFQTGLELVTRKAWDSALAEFLRSRQLYPTQAAVKNAAVCLRELGRFDEALDMYDELTARFADKMSADDRSAVEADVKRIERFVGVLSVTSEPPGAVVVVDGRERGRTPLAKPVRVTVGTRAVRVSLPSYAPFEAKVTVSSGEARALTAKLAVVSSLGTLRVGGPEGYEVVVDGAVVGKTPWQGTISAGEHTVALRGTDDMGSATRVAVVGTGETTELLLSAGRLPATLRVEATPSDAQILIDGRRVGAGSWTGDVPSGEHRARVQAEWHESEEQTLHATSIATQTYRPVLEPVARAYLELTGGVVPAFDSGVRGGLGLCNVSCTGFLFGLRGGYLITPRLALELSGGTLVLPHHSALTGVVYQESADAAVVFGGPSIRYQLFDRTPLTFRLSAFFARFLYSTTVPAANFNDIPISIVGRTIGNEFWAPGGGPEVRFGYRVGRTFVLDLGAAFYFFFPPTVPGRPMDDPEVPAAMTPSIGGFTWALPITLALHVDL